MSSDGSLRSPPLRRLVATCALPALAMLPGLGCGSTTPEPSVQLTASSDTSVPGAGTTGNAEIRQTKAATTEKVRLTYQTAGDIPMPLMQARGCMFDGILFEREVMAGHDADLQMLARSQCFYVPRAVETWNVSPDFSKIRQNLDHLRTLVVHRTDPFLFGAFIAESVLTTGTYRDAAGKTYPPADFCIPGSKDVFGPNTCTPDLARAEFQSYVLAIVSGLLDLGISDFLFGQLLRIDPSLQGAPALFAQIRDLAAQKNKLVVIGGQTDSIRDAAYLSSFDYIVGGSYLTRSGEILMGSPVSGAQAQAPHAALLWHQDYRTAGPKVFIELDWWNTDDDIHRFIALEPTTRANVIGKIRATLQAIDVGFLLPFRTPLNGGVGQGTCYGGNQWVYSANRAFGCQDEDYLNALLPKTAAPEPAPTPKPTPNPPSDEIRLRQLLEAQAREAIRGFYMAYLRRTPSVADLNHYVHQVVTGQTSIGQLEQQFAASDDAFLVQVCRNYLGRDPDPTGLQFYQTALTTGQTTRAQIEADLRYCSENHTCS